MTDIVRSVNNSAWNISALLIFPQPSLKNYCTKSSIKSVAHIHASFLLPHFKAHPQNCEKQLLVSSRLSVRPSGRMEKLHSQRTDFHEIW